MKAAIVRFLKESKEPVSGEALSRHLQMSRAGVWKHVQELRALGYQIEAGTRCGYRLVASPDKMIPWEIKEGLATINFGKEIYCFESLPSTMDKAFELAGQGAAEGTVVCSETQTKGRGRMGRRWRSPKAKGIYLSVILRPSLPLTEVSKLTLMTAVSVAEALRHISGLDIGIKWPNDLLYRDKKLAGILTELNAEVDRINFVIIGMGVNVTTNMRQIPAGATSLRAAAGREFSRIRIIQGILRSLETKYTSIQRVGFAEILDQWKKNSCTLGHRIVLSDGDRRLEGTAVDLAEDGGLLIRTAEGSLVKRMSGDVAVVKDRET